MVADRLLWRTMAELLDPREAALAAADLDWEIEAAELVKVHRAKDFQGAMNYVNAVALKAEAAGHHPDIDIRWDTVTLRLSTHSAGGITQADIDLAGDIDLLG